MNSCSAGGRLPHAVSLEHRADGEQLVHRGARGLRLVGDLGVRLAVDVVAHAFDDAGVLHRERASVRPGEREELEDGASAFEVHHERAAALHDARVDALALEQLHEAFGQVLALHGDLEVEVAARVGHEPAAEEGPAQVSGHTALLGDERGLHAQLKAALDRQHAHVGQRFGQPRLGRHLDEVVRRLVQHASAHREVRLEVVQLVQKLDDEPRNARRVRRDLDAVPALAAEEQRALDAHERRKHSLVAVRARRGDARELVFHLRRERHSLKTPANASRRADGSCQVGRCGSTRSRAMTTGPCAWTACTSR